jgi:SAM-dependent methyltransferase
MMLNDPGIDPVFLYASTFLKKALDEHGDKLINKNCLDLPCGNGRNTFLLASEFERVEAIDINEQYLEAITRNSSAYEKRGEVKVSKADLMETNIGVAGYGFICHIHFWDKRLAQYMIKNMSSGALLLIESPGCQGGNYQMLPSRAEMAALFAGADILIEQFSECKHPDNKEERGSIKLLVRK